MAEINFKLVAIPPEDLTVAEFKDYLSMAAPHALFEDPSLVNAENLKSNDFRRQIVTEVCARYSNFAVSLEIKIIFFLFLEKYISVMLKLRNVDMKF